MIRRAIQCATLMLLSAAAENCCAQVSNPYHLNGSATQDNCHCYTLTRETMNQSGSVWNVNKIDLSQSFDFKFNVFLGCTDAGGADGIAFVLQPISTSVGSTGQGLGFGGISPSVGVAIDTWQNSDDYDPSYDNISIVKNGNVVHSPGSDLAAPMTALASGDNIEDCKFHTFRISWNATSKLLSTQIDGEDRVSATVDMVQDIFGNDPMVYWGFTGATGGSFNQQRVCTSLDPAFGIAEGSNVCYPAPLHFSDSSTSFGTIKKWFWDFGDGSVDSVQNPPTHVYRRPGLYEVKLSIVGNDDCISDPATQTVVVGSKPVAEYHYVPEQPCKGAPVYITDSSKVEFGTINNWRWSIAGQLYSVEDPGQVVLAAANRIELTVSTLEGCVSDKMIDSIIVRPLPCPKFYVPSAFSPNGDGQNDRFEFVASGMLSIDVFKIYNRYGQLVYSSSDIHAGWDGRYRGIAQPSGVYIYVVKGRDLVGREHSEKGTVTLVR